MNLGIDFGSTYSSFASYNKTFGTVDLCKPTTSESEAVPSVACLDDDNHLITGHEARDQIKDEPETVSFDAFKMLLTETDQETLNRRGFRAPYTPQHVTERFLDQQIKKVLTNQSEARVDNLVICVPEVWTTKESANRGLLDGRSILRDICRNVSGVEQVQVVSEPAAASAYFSHYYQKLTGTPMSGYVLVIDYGGGTLDLTLTQVKLTGGRRSTAEIEVKNRAGVGENHSGKIGDAGIAYMEEVVRLAVAESAEAAVDNIGAIDPKTPAFRRAYLMLERKLKGQVIGVNHTESNGEESFRLYNAVQDCIDDISHLADNHEVFTTVKYGKARIVVTYSQLIRAYDKLIRQRLDACLKTMTSYMDEAGIDYENSENDQFHVVLVGGFGKFIFVQNQIHDFFDFSSTGDRRFEYDLGEKREFAVAMGAALLAEKIITIKHTAPYAIGVVSYLADKTPIPNFAICYRQEISEEKDYWIRSGNGVKKFINAHGGVSTFLIGYDVKGEQRNKLVIKPELARSIKAAYEKLGAEYESKFPGHSKLGLEHNLGFHMDESEIVTLLIRSVKTKTVERIELKSYQEMFELTEV